MTLHRWAMFSNEGEQRVQQIVESAMDLAGSVTDDGLWQWAYSSLELLSKDPQFKEATDTEVCQSVWDHLVQEQMIDPQKTNYWFYIEWYGQEERGEKPFHRCVEAIDNA